MTYTCRHVVRSHVPETPRERAVERRNVWSLALPDVFKHLARRSEDTWKSNGAFHFFFFFWTNVWASSGCQMCPRSCLAEIRSARVGTALVRRRFVWEILTYLRQSLRE